MHANFQSVFPKELFDELKAESLTVPATHRFLLSPINRLFVLEKGGMDIFALSLAGKQNELIGSIVQQMASRATTFPGQFLPGPMRFLKTVKEGEWLFPFPLELQEMDFCVIGVAQEICELRYFCLENLQELLPHSAILQSFVMLQVQEWVKGLQTLFSDQPYHQLPTILDPYERVSLESGTLFISPRFSESSVEQGIHWLQIFQGSACVLGINGLMVESGPTLYPVSTVWFQVNLTCELELFPSQADFTLNPGLWAGLFLFQTHLLRLLALDQVNQQLKNKREILLRTASDQEILEQSLNQLQTILERGRHVPSLFVKDPIYQVCQLIGYHLDLQFKWPKNGIVAEDLDEFVDQLCRYSQIYYRRIRLSGNWWKARGVPMLGFYAENEQPLALLPHPTINYELVDPSMNQRLNMTADLAKQLSSTAYMFYRQFPLDKIKLLDIWTFTVWKYRRDWFIFICLMFLSLCAMMSLPILTRIVFDEVIPNRNESLLAQVAIGGFLITLATLAFNFGRESIVLRLEGLTDHDLEMAIWQRLLSLPIRFFRKYSIYDLFIRTSSISAIRQLLTSHTIEVLISSFFAIFYFFLMFYFSPILAFIGLAVILIEFIATLAPLFFSVRYNRRLLDLRVQASNKILEMVEAFTKIRLAGAEIRMFQRWEQVFTTMKQADLSILLLRLKTGVFNTFWSNTSTWILYFAIIVFLESQQPGKTPSFTLSLGNFMAFITVFAMLNASISQLGTTFVQFSEIIPLWEKGKSLVEADVEEIINKTDPGILPGELRADHLTFGYQPDTPLNVRDVSFNIPSGNFVGIVGPSGCGKSTLLRLLIGFETPNQGAVYYDNKDLKGLNLQAVRSQLGVVLQTGGLLDGSILDNINLGRYYSEEEIQETLALSGVNTFLKDLPMGIHTVLTNGGSSLSGGQRQLILLARALVGKPKIMILDEATSALDNRVQRIIQENLNRLPMTRLVVAHRLSTIQQADCIYVMDKGTIVDQGTFLELANRPGLFLDLLTRAKITLKQVQLRMNEFTGDVTQSVTIPAVPHTHQANFKTSKYKIFIINILNK